MQIPPCSCHMQLFLSLSLSVSLVQTILLVRSARLRDRFDQCGLRYRIKQESDNGRVSSLMHTNRSGLTKEDVFLLVVLLS